MLGYDNVVNDIDAKVKTKGHVELYLLTLAQGLDVHHRSVVWGITAALKKLPLTAIKDKTTIGEGELLTTYFDPILASILANPDENVLLRWANVTCDATRDKRPDATISKLTQLVFGPSLGFGEAKVAQATCDKYMLCHDLIRLAAFTKDTIDENKLYASLSFQIHGFNVTFFLTRLRHDGIFVMQEIAHMTFPRSIEELASFINMKNLKMLLKITEAFWRLCAISDNEGLIKAHARPTHPSLYCLIDATKDRRRLCSIRFES
ncbi:hypothetical protein G6F46_005654 [Rhizopus delemar]|uniref:Uncharacterized protein n=3 Tax=Rhizopus TaxID=4842 RepID=I1CQG2_RHIO9|nr:hypothetical protein RO3G_15403 [Rhizopus delemar RA 99-880]KAG1460368.1 hypothetical protein G6F55_004213 [Rhizopus delemar]KAG1544953.1 hypothetical protein G6F51_005750 [Rhizopus arrhizus]KAG1498618.1 hypothetical protein G6F54_004961 [Rhizopus delemar]KAG1512373.1 hypothetical protein G6F53_005237 [Rhizopus delemar]|eukprot:EIE90692.1 hypothetical protein RO3G_15403 [Rhizopus delemar RA 99-880]